MEDLLHSGLAQLALVLIGDDAADHHRHVAQPRLAECRDDDGAEIVARAMEKPVRILAENSGQDGAVVADEVRTRGEKSFNVGFNALTGEYEDMIKAGVIDPTKVTRSALQNAASIAGLMLTTEVMITRIDADAPGNKVSGAIR